VKLLDLWLPPDGAGPAVACLATSFTFDADFFSADCLARFLRLTDAYGERDEIADIALMLEEEERLSEARVAVLVDRSCNPEPRNLRWDLIPVSVPGGLFHAKTAILMWANATRFLIGSGNLTSAGYRRQVEIGTAIDLADGGVSRSCLLEFISELRSIVVELTPGSEGEPGPRRRVAEILDLAEQRVETSALPAAVRGMAFAVGATRTGTSPLSRLKDVWRGSPPKSVVALAPFWDSDARQLGARELLRNLTQRNVGSEPTTATFVVPVEPLFGGPDVVRAPAALQNVAPRRINSRVCAFNPREDDDRRLHAKCVLYESADWVAAMIGSSNISAKGLGLDLHPHRELNLWIGCRADSTDAKRLRGLVSIGPDVRLDSSWEPTEDEDEMAPPLLPLGFGEAQLVTRNTIRLRFETAHLPAEWRVLLPAGRSIDEATLVDADEWKSNGMPAERTFGLSDDNPLPAGLVVRWQEADQWLAATWIVNVGELAILPPPDELRALSSTVLLTVLASTRPLREAAEHALRQAAVAAGNREDLDPLKRFDNSGFLLQRVHRASSALWGLEERLSRPIASLETLDWRLNGAIGPVTLGRRLAEEAMDRRQLVGETQFLLAELAMTVDSIPWTIVASRLDPHHVEEMIAETQYTIHGLSTELGGAEAMPSSMQHYVADVFERCQR